MPSPKLARKAHGQGAYQPLRRKSDDVEMNDFSIKQASFQSASSPVPLNGLSKRHWQVIAIVVLLLLFVWSSHSPSYRAPSDDFNLGPQGPGDWASQDYQERKKNSDKFQPGHQESKQHEQAEHEGHRVQNPVITSVDAVSSTQSLSSTFTPLVIATPTTTLKITAAVQSSNTSSSSAQLVPGPSSTSATLAIVTPAPATPITATSIAPAAKETNNVKTTGDNTPNSTSDSTSSKTTSDQVAPEQQLDNQQNIMDKTRQLLEEQQLGNE